MKEGLYKIEFHTSQGRGRGIIYATDGKLRGGNSAFAFVGSYSVDGEEILARVTTTRHTEDPQFKPLFGTDVVTVVLRGAANGNLIDFEGTALQLPSLPIKIVFSRLND